MKRVRYVCECGAEKRLTMKNSTKPGDRIRCKCGGEMEKRPPRLANHFHPTRGR